VETPSIKNVRSGKGGISRKSDSELIKLYLESRDATYFSLLYNKYSGKIYSKCISLLKNEALAQDATQDIFIKIYLNLTKFSERS